MHLSRRRDLNYLKMQELYWREENNFTELEVVNNYF